MAVTDTSICNMSLGRIGAKRIDDITDDTDTKSEAIQCRLHYAQTRDALLRSHWWRFASARADLAVVTNGDFAHWTSDDPDDWTATEAGTDDVSQVGAGEGHGGTGTKKCNIYSAADGTGVQIAQTIATVVGLDYKFSININKITAGELAVENLPEPTSGDTDWDSIGIKTVTFTADDTSFSLVIKGHTAVATNITFDSISVVVIPAFEWTYGYMLPSDFLAMKSIYEDNSTPTRTSTHSYALEGKLLLTDDSAVQIRYVKQVTDPTVFDPLFIEVLILMLALKFIPALAGGAVALRQDVQNELTIVMRKVRALDRQETNTIGRADLGTWNDSRY